MSKTKFQNFGNIDFLYRCPGRFAPVISFRGVGVTPGDIPAIGNHQEWLDTAIRTPVGGWSRELVGRSGGRGGLDIQGLGGEV